MGQTRGTRGCQRGRVRGRWNPNSSATALVVLDRPVIQYLPRHTFTEEV